MQTMENGKYYAVTTVAHGRWLIKFDRVENGILYMYGCYSLDDGRYRCGGELVMFRHVCDVQLLSSAFKMGLMAFIERTQEGV